MTKQSEGTTVHTHQTAPTQFAEASAFASPTTASAAVRVQLDPDALNARRIAVDAFGRVHPGYRSTSRSSYFMHFTGTMDHCDPVLTDGFGQDHEVIFRTLTHKPAALKVLF